ncbi:MAG: quinoprotein dehydrogenase-associated putative ABC transporter substrate-binding protein [Methylococcales bacterium]|nr:quinoprotein dehydrogenase-associated putative ABC transporter substrate-binding protein [Methylococcales bacterium]MDD5755268.1 quinoprotein dehydrogenase-associated putative ABC transporter substrate-binding protein [Methylococcales bacterium]
MKLISTILGLALTVSASLAYAEKFKVCADPLNPPYSSKNEDGFENKIASLFAKSLGQELEYFWFPQRIGFIRNSLNAFTDENAVESKEFKCDIVMGMPAGSDMVLTTQPYYHSTYVLLIAKGRGWDTIQTAEQLAQLPSTQQSKLKIAMFDRGAGTDWLQKHDLLDQGIPYQSMTGDSEHNVAMQMSDDLKAKKIDMVILWGVLAGHVVSQNPNGYNVIPMKSENGLKFDYQMAMGVRKNDKARQEQLNKLINEKANDIAEILAQYHIPLLPLEAQPAKKD